MLPILPDSPSSVLQLLNADKKALNQFAQRIITDVQGGYENPLEIHVLLKKYDYVLEEIKKGIKENLITEVAKYGDKPFEYAGAEVHHTPTATSYDFDHCGDTEWETLDSEVKALTDKRKKREEFLKAISQPVTIVNELTGEMETISAPIKKQAMGVKVTLK